MLLLREIVVISGVGSFELAAHSLGLFVFSILLTLRVELILNSSWHIIFIPLYTALIIDGYYTVIQLTRLVLHALKDEKEKSFLFFSFILSLFGGVRLGALIYLEIETANMLEYQTSFTSLIAPIALIFSYTALRTLFVFKTIDRN